MHAGESYRRIQEERELIDRALPTQHDGKVRALSQVQREGKREGRGRGGREIIWALVTGSP